MRGILFLGLLGNLAVASTGFGQECEVSPPGAVSWYAFEGNANDTVGVRHGEFFGNAMPVPAGIVGGGASFAGNGGIMLPVDSFSELTIGTLEGWFYFQEQSGAIFSSLGTIIGGSQNNLVFEMTGGRFRVVIRPEEGELLDMITDSSLARDAWHHFAYVSSPSGNRLYIDGDGSFAASYASGSPTTEAFFSALAGPQEFYIGVLISSDGVLRRFWNGLIDELTIYDRALSDAEITAIWVAGSAGKCGEDRDADGVFDDLDNCPDAPNPQQFDSDGDGVGDECDNCPLSNPTQADADSNGRGDLCDQIIALLSASGEFEGPPGPQGVQGEPGPPGPAGPQGATGPPGRDADETRVTALEQEILALQQELDRLRFILTQLLDDDDEDEDDSDATQELYRRQLPGRALDGSALRDR